MTEQETREKIFNIIREFNVKKRRYSTHTEPNDDDELADALIAAGIVDKSDYASMKETAVRYKAEVSKAENRGKAAEHRAEVAERALRIFAENCSCADCPFFGGCQIIPDVEDDFSCCFDMYLAIAEKQLAEEGKDVE